MGNPCSKMIAVIAIVLVTATQLPAQQLSPSSIMNADSAVRTCSKLLGLRLPENFSSVAAQQMASEVTITDTVTPFVAPLIDGRPGWRIDLGALSSDSGSTRLPNTRKWRCYMSIDTNSSIVLSLISELEAYDTSLVRRPTRAHAEYELSAYGVDKYIGLPTIAPLTSLAQALKKVPGNTRDAAVIETKYLLWLRAPGQPVIPVWVISCYGCSNSNSARHSDWPKYKSMFLRTIVDASTGKMIVADNRTRVE